MYRYFLRLVDLLPLPSLKAQRIIAGAVVVTQAGISVTGAIVRVTASGLGCPTWPQCFPGSFTPVQHAEVPLVHQVVEFGNRLLTGYGRGALVGLAYGAIWWVLGPLMMMPLMMGMPLFTVDMPALLSLMGHMVYGAILGLTAVRVLAGRHG